MLGFGSLGEFALGESQTPSTRTFQPRLFSNFATPLVNTGLAVAILATTFGGFVAPPVTPAAATPIPQFAQFSLPPAKRQIIAGWSFVAPPIQAQTAIFTAFSQPQIPRVNLPDEQPSALFEIAPPPVISIVFTQFSQPQFSRTVIPDEQPSTLFEILPPASPPFTGFARFEGNIQARFNAALVGYVSFVAPLPVPVDTHDGVWVKRKKRSGRDPIDLELEEKASRRAALELAVYGPAKQIIPPKPVKRPVINSPVDVADLAKIVLSARQAHDESIRAQASSDDEDDLESILREIL